MKITAVSHLFPNRVRPSFGVFVKERLRYVAKRVDLSVVAPVPRFPLIDLTEKYRHYASLEEFETIEGLPVFHPRYFMIPKFLKNTDAFFYSRSLKGFMERALATHKTDLLDFHWVYPDAIGGLDWARKLGKRTVVTIRGNESIYYFNAGSIRSRIQAQLRLFDHVIAVSSDLSDKVIDHFQVDPNRVSVIPNGIDTSRFHVMDKREAMIRCGLSLGQKYIVAVCRLSKEKGLDSLISAFSRLADVSARLIIIGDGPLKASLVTLTDSLGIQEKVHFIGAVAHSDIPYWYNAADLFCLPSLWEGCPNVVIEALACGTPIVASRVGGIPDLVSDAECGELVLPGDTTALSEALRKGLSKEWDRFKISRQGSMHSWDDVADKVVEVYQNVLSR